MNSDKRNTIGDKYCITFEMICPSDSERFSSSQSSLDAESHEQIDNTGSADSNPDRQRPPKSRGRRPSPCMSATPDNKGQRPHYRDHSDMDVADDTYGEPSEEYQRGSQPLTSGRPRHRDSNTTPHDMDYHTQDDDYQHPQGGQTKPRYDNQNKRLRGQRHTRGKPPQEELIFAKDESLEDLPSDIKTRQPIRNQKGRKGGSSTERTYQKRQRAKDGAEFGESGRGRRASSLSNGPSKKNRKYVCECTKVNSSEFTCKCCRR